jgi:hypothetical protein
MPHILLLLHLEVRVRVEVGVRVGVLVGVGVGVGVNLPHKGCHLHEQEVSMSHRIRLEPISL